MSQQENGPQTNKSHNMIDHGEEHRCPGCHQALLSQAQVVAWLRISPDLVDKLLHLGLPFVDIEEARWFFPSDVMEWLIAPHMAAAGLTEEEPENGDQEELPF